MGGNPSILAPRLASNTVLLLSYVDILLNIRFEKTLLDSRFLKTLLCVIEDPLNPQRSMKIIIKLFIKPDSVGSTQIDLSTFRTLLLSQREALFSSPFCVPFTKFLETERAAYLVRQYITSTLTDKLSTRPFLESLERLWIAFQALSALATCHDKGITHGDLKTENVMLSSWNSLYLTDFSCYKPFYLLEDNPSDFFFYFDTSKRRNCYLAPERFYKGSTPREPSFLDRVKADIFSLGCVLAEVYLDGGPIFTLAQLFKYRKNEYKPGLEGVRDQSMRALISSMISLNKKDRKTAREYLELERGKTFPELFYLLIHLQEGYMPNAAPEKNTEIDSVKQRIDVYYTNFTTIAQKLGLEYHYHHTSSPPPQIPFRFNLPGIPSEYSIKPGRAPNGCALIALCHILSAARNTRACAERVRAIELVVAFSEHVSDDAKLDRALPFLVALLDDDAVAVRCCALRAMAALLSAVGAALPLNIAVYPDYILPKLRTYLARDYVTPHEKVIFAALIPMFARDAARFARSSGSKMPQLLELLVLGALTGDAQTRIAALEGAHVLCAALGRERARDVVLSHVITYLNDRSPLLRLAFVRAAPALAVHVGAVSMSQYLLPLLRQLVADPEEHVVVGVLKCYCELVKLGLVGKSASLELVRSVACLILHPNEWVRQGAVSVVVTVAQRLAQADAFCAVYPAIAPFLENEVVGFTWEAVYTGAKKGVPRTVYEVACEWGGGSRTRGGATSGFWGGMDNANGDTNEATGKVQGVTGFGKRGVDTNKVESGTFFIQNGKRLNGGASRGWTYEKDATLGKPYNYGKSGLEGDSDTMDASYEKNGGSDLTLSRKSLYSGLSSVLLSKIGGQKPKKQEPRMTASLNGALVQLTADDALWVKKLRAAGLQDQDLWKIYALREHIASSCRALGLKPHAEAVVADISLLGVFPVSVFFSVLLQPAGGTSGRELFAPGPYLDVTESDNVINLGYTEPSTAARELDNGGSSHKPQVTLGTVVILARKATPSTRTSQETAYGELNASHHLGTHLRPVVPVVVDSYMGANVYVRKYLDTCEIPLRPDYFHEFGARILPQNEAQSWPPSGELVAHLNEHKARISALATLPDGSYFVSGSIDGQVRVWDGVRMERNVTSTASGGVSVRCVRALCFIGPRDCIAVGGNGVSVYRIGRANKNKRKVEEIRRWVGGVVVDLCWGTLDTQEILILALDNCKIVILEVVTMSEIFRFQNEVRSGGITSVCADNQHGLLYVGTRSGYIDIYDLRYRVALARYNNGNVSLEKKSSTIRKIDCSFSMPDRQLFSVLDDDGLTMFEINQKTGKLETVSGNGSLSLKNENEKVDDFTFSEFSDFSIEDKEAIVTYSEVKVGPQMQDLMYLYSQNKSLFYQKVLSNKSIRLGKKEPSVSKNELMISKAQRENVRRHHDEITAVCVLVRPFLMVVGGDGSGVINVYK